MCFFLGGGSSSPAKGGADGFRGSGSCGGDRVLLADVLGAATPRRRRRRPRIGGHPQEELLRLRGRRLRQPEPRVGAPSLLPPRLGSLDLSLSASVLVLCQACPYLRFMYRPPAGT